MFLNPPRVRVDFLFILTRNFRYAILLNQNCTLKITIQNTFWVLNKTTILTKKRGGK